MFPPPSRLNTGILILLFFVCYTAAFAQSKVTPVFPADKATQVNVGLVKWNAPDGSSFDLYFGTQPEPPLYRENLTVKEEKPLIIELNRTYYWKIVEKIPGKDPVPSRVFSFSTLPIQLKEGLPYQYIVDPRDDKVYSTLKIGDKEWFAQNLDYSIPGQSFYYNNVESNKIYGQLYNGSQLNEGIDQICPPGWHLPGLNEWKSLLEQAGGRNNAGQRLKEASPKYWQSSQMIRTNEAGLTVLPAGSRDSKPTYSNLSKYAYFWTSSPDPKTPGSFVKIDFGFMRDQVNDSPGTPTWGYSVRCVKN